MILTTQKSRSIALLPVIVFALSGMTQAGNGKPRKLIQSETRTYITKDCILSNPKNDNKVAPTVLATIGAIVGPVIVSNLTGKFAEMIEQKSKRKPIKSEGSFSTYLFKADPKFNHLHYSGLGCVTIVNDYSFTEGARPSGVIRQVEVPGGYPYSPGKTLDFTAIKSVLEANQIIFTNGSPNMVFEFDIVVSDDRTAFVPRPKYLYYPRSLDGLTSNTSRWKFEPKYREQVRKLLRVVKPGQDTTFIFEMFRPGFQIGGEAVVRLPFLFKGLKTGTSYSTDSLKNVSAIDTGWKPLPRIAGHVQKAFVTAKGQVSEYNENTSNCSNVDMSGNANLTSETMPAAETGCFEPLNVKVSILQAREDNKLGIFISEILQGSKAGFAKAVGESLQPVSASAVIDAKIKIANACAAYLLAQADTADESKKQVAELKKESLKLQVQNLRLVIGSQYKPGDCPI